jgi:hypothetical protein
MKKYFLHLLNTAINGAATGVLAGITTSVAGIPMSLKQLGIAAGSGAIVATVRHIQQSPIIPIVEEE